jgi:hypothetical protein
MSILKRYLGTLEPRRGLWQSLEAVRQRAGRPTDICDHLETLFLECLGMEPG